MEFQDKRMGPPDSLHYLKSGAESWSIIIYESPKERTLHKTHNEAALHL